MTIDIVDYGSETDAGTESGADQRPAQEAAPAPAPQIDADALARKIAAQLRPARTEAQRESRLESKMKTLIAQGYNPSVVQEVAGIVDAYYGDAEEFKSGRSTVEKAEAEEEAWHSRCFGLVDDVLNDFEAALPSLGKLESVRAEVTKLVSEEFKNDPELNKHLAAQYEARKMPHKAQLVKAAQKAVKKYADLAGIPLKEAAAVLNLGSSRPTPTASTSGGDDMANWNRHQVALYKAAKAAGASDEVAARRAKEARSERSA